MLSDVSYSNIYGTNTNTHLRKPSNIIASRKNYTSFSNLKCTINIPSWQKREEAGRGLARRMNYVQCSVSVSLRRGKCSYARH
jgi:hypothetical protein